MKQERDQLQIQKPPVTIGPTIHLAWGLSLTFSHEEGQRSLGETFVDRFKNLWEEYKDNELARRYLDNLSALLSACVRNIGWQRDVYVRYLDTRDEERRQRIKSANDLGDITSLNTESILSRLVAILFGGSALALLFPETQTTASGAGSSAGIEPTVLWFLIGGCAGFVLVTAGLKLWKSWRISRIIKRTFNLKHRYWENTAKTGFTEALIAFATQLRSLMVEYYSEFYEKEEPLKEYFENDQIWEYVNQKVLPSTESYATKMM